MMDSQQCTRWQAMSFLFARLILGLIFFMAGTFKVFELGPMGHAERFFLPYADTFLPIWSLWLVGVSIPIVELLAGALLIIGWQVRRAAVSLGVVLVIVTFGHLLRDPLFAFHTHVIPRLALVLFILILPAVVYRYSVDHWLRSRPRGSL
jgi:uncharacterized membrane protein YphA (DoxX/SURF4 family)